MKIYTINGISVADRSFLRAVVKISMYLHIIICNYLDSKKPFSVCGLTDKHFRNNKKTKKIVQSFVYQNINEKLI